MKILVAMSGGVDSSVAALLLKQQGHEIAGITMKLGVKNKDGSITHLGGSAVEDAAQVCAFLSIPHIIDDLTDLFNSRVINYFVDDYVRGRTPNPCVMCNRYLKFGALADRMKALGFDHIATGHYARIIQSGGSTLIRRCGDERKDQTYFLWNLPRAILPSVIFPLSELTKPEIRAMAHDANLPVAHKAESQDICFIPGDYRDLIEARSGIARPGVFVSSSGRTYGQHRGIPYYTIGQRRGLGISASAPLYVTGFNLKTNEIILGEKDELKGNGLTATNLNLFTDTLPADLKAKVRFAHNAAACDAAIDGDTMTVRFHEPVDSITAGQSVAIYHDDCLLGGGIIDTAI
jgi:tRNA-specific 2-thiouridylase